MKLSVFLLFTCVFELLALDTNAQNAKISLSSNILKMGQLFKEIELQTDYLVVYSNSEVNLEEEIELKRGTATVMTVLYKALASNELYYEFDNDYIIISRRAIATKASQIGIKITGMVTDESGEPIIGANVIEKGTTNGTSTDIDGNFALSVSENAVLQVSYIGYIAQDIPIGNKTDFHIRLKDDLQALDEVVVVGYGSQKKVNLTGSVSNVNFENDATLSRPLTTASSALSGLSPGLFVRQTSGSPESDGASIKIRGKGSLNSGEDPLVIIDGQPGDMNSISPNDISTISILKDAASSAIYGSRASNGVILITTKAGSNTAGKVTFSYTGNVGFTEPTKLYDIISNTADHMSLINQIERNSGRTALSFTQEKIDNWREKSKTDPLLYPNTDWWDAMIKSNMIHNHSLSARGGNDKISFYTSFNYLKNDGLMKNTGYERYTFRNNLIYQVNDWLKLGNILTAMIGKADPASANDVFQWFIATTPGLLPRHPDGRYGGAMTGGSESGSNNQLAVLENARGEKHTQRYTGKIYATITPIENLNVTGSYFLDMYNFNHWSSAQLYDRWDFQNEIKTFENNGIMGIGNSYRKRQRNVVDLFGSYSYTLHAHDFSVLAGYNQEYYKDETFSANKRDLYSLDTPVLDAASTNVSSGGNATDFAMRSFFGRINYTYAQRYLFEANLRYDGSSRFSPDERWGVFPSFSVGWRVSEEAFWSNLKNTVENLKLRASWGQLGNNSIGNYDWQDVYNKANYSFNGSIVKGVAPDAIANNGITWETTNVLNIGLDMNMFNKLSVTLDYYNKYQRVYYIVIRSLM